MYLIYLMILLQILLVVTLVPFQTQAASATYSNIFWQPGAGKNGIVGGITQSLIKAKYSGSFVGAPLSGDFTSNGTTLGINYHRGLTDLFDVGLGTGWGTSSSNSKLNFLGTTTESTTKYEGMNNISLFFNGRGAFGAGNAFYYGVTFSISPADKTRDIAAEKYNNFSGGQSTTPYLGVHFSMGSGIFVGGGANYSLPGERKTKNSNPNSETTTTGGNALALLAFVEFPSVSWRPTLQLGYSKPEKTTSTTGTTTTDSNGIGIMTAQFSGELNVGTGFDFLPGIAYATVSEKNYGTITYDSFDFFFLTLSARCVF